MAKHLPLVMDHLITVAQLPRLLMGTSAMAMVSRRLARDDHQLSKSDGRVLEEKTLEVRKPKSEPGRVPRWKANLTTTPTWTM